MLRFNKTDIEYLEDMANLIRKDVITMIHEAGSGHPGLQQIS